MNDQNSGASPPESGDNAQTIYSFDLSGEKAHIPEDRLVEVGKEFENKIWGRQEWVRTALAVGAFLSLVAVLGFLMGAVYKQITVDNIEKIATVVVTPLTGIVGTIIGFYFAERRIGGTRELKTGQT